ncbi:DUF3885 domain-containing protein [Aeromonas salmonicida]|uniref:DUF3885 domain-containing protein n=1 Tax=Aeromonas salmonicida TaxID=645 RepID=UPI0038D43C60
MENSFVEPLVQKNQKKCELNTVAELGVRHYIHLEYLDQMNFKNDLYNLKFEKPLFFNWSIGLRFEIGSLFDDGELYFNEAHKRAVAIFEACFSNDDEIIIVYQKESDRRRRKIRKSDYILKQIAQSGKFEYCDVHGIYVCDCIYSLSRRGPLKCSCYCNPNNCWKRVIVQGLKRSDINYSNILLAVVNTDFPNRQPSTKGECYFVNSTTGLILNLYDDRGMDVISAASDTLKPIYEHFNDWLLDVNREDMDLVFC